MYQVSEKITHEMKKYLQITYLRRELHPEHITAVTQQIKKQTITSKMGQGFKQIFLQRRYTNDQLANEKKCLT